MFNDVLENGMYVPVRQCQHDKRRQAQSAPEAYRPDTSGTCHVERQHRTVSYYNAVRRFRFDHSVDRGRDSAERLLGCLGPKHKLIRRPVESLDRLFKLILRRKERNVAPMMLLQSFCDPNRNPQSIGNYLGRF